MGKISCGYGSEWHLLRYLGYHGQKLQEEILQQTDGEKIYWLDYKFSKKNKPRERDRGLRGLEFLDRKTINRWKRFWPQRGNVMNWDAVGKLYYSDRQEWLLVGAKTHIDEIYSWCGSKSDKSRSLIANAFTETKKAFNAEKTPLVNWLEPYYQLCSRLTLLYFLRKKCKPEVKAKLLMIYFYGDKFRNRNCPRTPEEWKFIMRKIYQDIGVDETSELMNDIHSIYLQVNPNSPL